MKVLQGIGAVAGTLAVIGAFYAALYYGGIVGNRVQANYAKRVVTSKIEQSVRTATFAQAAYEQFFNDCNAVAADNLKIEQAKARVSAMRSLPADGFGQNGSKLADAITDLTGLQQIQADTAARYNANAAEYTRGQFLAASLPSSIAPPYLVTCQ